MRKIVLIATAVFTVLFCVNAQESNKGLRVYSIGISEDIDTYEINEKLIKAENSVRGSRGIVDDIFMAYRNSFSKGAGSTVGVLLDAGISEMAELMKDHRADWEKEVNKQCEFKKDFKMNQEIPDFYARNSSIGSLDLSDIAFRGFSFRQSIRFPSGNREPVEVFYAHFSLDTTSVGMNRMVHHSKFQVRLDSLMFNPYVSEIPVDPGRENGTSIEFDFARRKDFMLTLKTTLKSSWICENMSVIKDYPLGDFMMELMVDPSLLDSADSCFRYSAFNPADSLKAKSIVCTGESFVVPRSYVGVVDGVAFWGTGQYSLEMSLTESCKINEAYYIDQERSSDGKIKWNRKAWKQEWKQLKKNRKFEDTHIGRALTQVSSKWTDGQWVTEIFSPGTSVMVTTGEKLIKDFSLKEEVQEPSQKP